MSYERDSENEPTIECPACEGVGSIDIGDCEDGIEEICPECNGTGSIEDEAGLDSFNPNIDAFLKGD